MTLSILMLVFFCGFLFTGTALAQRQSKVIRLQHAKATEMIDLARSLLSPRGTVVADTRTNSLVVADEPASLSAVEELVRQLDVALAQVSVEVGVYETTDTRLKDAGFQWGSDSGAILRFIGPARTTTFPLGGPELPPPAGLTAGAISANDFEGVLTALQQDTGTKLVANSMIVVEDNKTGDLALSRDTAVGSATTIAATAGGLSTAAVSQAERALTGRFLHVTPQTHPDGTITLSLEPSVVTAEPSETFPRFLDPLARVANTTVTVRSGETIAIGGSTGEDEISSSRTPGVKTPLTERQRESAEKRVLVILVTARTL